MDDKSDQGRGLALLLSMAPLAVSGCGDDNVGPDTDAASTGQVLTGTETGQGTDAESTADTTASPPDTTGDPPGTTGDPSGTTGDPSDTTSGSSTGSPPESPCVGYADIIAKCYDAKEGAMAYTTCVQNLESFYESYGMPCLDAYEEWLVCLSMLRCDVIALGCDDELVAYQKTCA